jgi:putative transposase
MDALMARMKELEDENRRLKKMYAEERLKAEIVAEALAKSGSAISAAGDGAVGRGEPVASDRPGLPGISHQPDLLSLQGQARCRERRDRGLAGTADK